MGSMDRLTRMAAQQAGGPPTAAWEHPVALAVTITDDEAEYLVSVTAAAFWQPDRFNRPGAKEFCGLADIPWCDVGTMSWCSSASDWLLKRACEVARGFSATLLIDRENSGAGLSYVVLSSRPFPHPTVAARGGTLRGT